MEANKILQANLLDIVFENRNQLYGAYELRKNYSRRTIKALTIALVSVAAIIAVTSYSQQDEFIPKEKVREQTIISDLEDTKEPEPLPPPVQPEPQPPARTQEFVTIVVKPDDQHSEPIATVDDLTDAVISDVTTEGPIADHTVTEPVMTDSDGKGIIAEKPKEEGPFRNVQIEAAFQGNWSRFLEKNLRGDVPVENGAPSGDHRVMIEFVVDTDGSISHLTALTSVGYGMEEEAIRVIKKAGKWTPAIQGGQAVKAYRRQSITFSITGE